MEDKNYYDILGVSVKASFDDITAAKNTLAKQYHPDSNLKYGIDTTAQMQEILEAYRILSDKNLRAQYDREISGRTSVMQTFDLHQTEDESSPTFVTYWKAAWDLYDIIARSEPLYKERDQTTQLAQLSMEAIPCILTLRNASIPEKYWHPDVMNHLLFTWLKNRNFTISYLLTLYDDHVRKNVPALEKLKLIKISYQFQHSVKRLIKY